MRDLDRKARCEIAALANALDHEPVLRPVIVEDYARARKDFKEARALHGLLARRLEAATRHPLEPGSISALVYRDGLAPYGSRPHRIRSRRDLLMAPTWEIIEGDCRASLAALPAGSVQTCVTSPPYFGLRDYGHDGQIGLEPTPDEFVAALVAVFREVRRVLRDDGTVWLNLGDDRRPVDGRVRVACRWLVPEERHHLGEAEPDAGERDGPADQEPRVRFSAVEAAALLLRRPGHRRSLGHRRGRGPQHHARQ
jgi:hypothetical protein